MVMEKVQVMDEMGKVMDTTPTYTIIINLKFALSSCILLTSKITCSSILLPQLLEKCMLTDRHVTTLKQANDMFLLHRMEDPLRRYFLLLQDVQNWSR